MWSSISDVYFYCSEYLFIYLTHNGNSHFSLCCHTFLESLFFTFIFQERLTFLRIVGIRFVWPCITLVTKTEEVLEPRRHEKASTSVSFRHPQRNLQSGVHWAFIHKDARQNVCLLFSTQNDNNTFCRVMLKQNKLEWN